VKERTVETGLVAGMPGRALDTLQELVRFGRLLAERFVEHGGLRSAAALTYTTLLSLVPLMTVALAIFAAFPAADRFSAAVQDFLFANFVPTAGEVLQQYLQEFADKASRLTGAGFAFLIVVALMLMRTIDAALNAIWEVREPRSPLNQFVIYWAILSLGPLLIGLSLFATSYLVSLPLFSEVTGGSGRKLLELAPILASTLGFSLVYWLVPNRRVPPSHALAGGILAGVLFEVAKRGFAWYLTNFPTYEAIYGALATIPIFLVWLYLTWIVALLGAEFTHTLGIFRRGYRAGSGRRLGLVDAVQLLGLLWEGYQRGEPRSLRRLAAHRRDWPEYRLDDLLRDLQAMRLVLRTADGRWALARDLRDVDLRELARSPKFNLPVPEHPGWPAGGRLAEVLGAADTRLGEVLAVPLAELVPVEKTAEQPAVTRSGSP
jgi:membrane protein